MPTTPTKPPHTDAQQQARGLKALLLARESFSGTRLGAYAGRQVPFDEAKLALLLMICGYKVRLNGDTLDIFTSAWVPALAPRVGETVLGHLNMQCALICPAGPMDPNDKRFDGIFATGNG